jgi:hypothetical protein
MGCTLEEIKSNFELTIAISGLAATAAAILFQ